MELIVQQGATSVRAQVFIADSTVTTGAGKTGVAFGSVTLSYFRDGDTATTNTTCVTAALGTWTSFGWKEIDSTNMPGWYEVGIPNAVFANTVRAASVSFKDTTAFNAWSAWVQFQLVPWNPQDAVRLGLTALPNANAGAAGGLPTATNSSGQVTASSVTGSVGSVNGTVNVSLATGGYLESATPATAQGGSSNTITLTAGESAVNGFYVGAIVKLVGLTGQGQARVITAYVGSTKVATVAPAWATAPDNTTTYNLFAGGTLVAAYATGQDPATLILDTVDSVDNGTNADTPRKWMRIWNSAMAGLASGLNSNAPKYRDLNNTKNRISATTDSSGDRTVVTLDGT